MIEETKLNWTEFIDTGSLSRDYASNIAFQGVRRASNSLVDWLIREQKDDPW